MSTIGRNLSREIVSSVLFVLFGFLALFAFFDLVNELEDIGRGGYKLQHAVGYVALGLPSRVYEVMPIDIRLFAFDFIDRHILIISCGSCSEHT